MAREINIHFMVMTMCNQTIRVDDDCTLTDEQIVAGLNGDRVDYISTDIETGSKLELWTPGSTCSINIGEVTKSDLADGSLDEFVLDTEESED